MSNQVVTLDTKPGVKRDGTPFDGHYYADASWCRFINGKPRKIGGYRNIAQFTAPIKEVHTFNKNFENLIHCFSTSKVEVVLVDNNGNGSAVYDRTPTGFVSYSEYTWTVDTAYDVTGSGQTRIYAHAARDDGAKTPIFYGTIDSTDALIPIVLLDTEYPATTGNITVGSASLTLTSATGYAIGDMIKVAGAGVAGADLWTDIINLVGLTATLRQTAATTVVSGDVAHILGTDGGIVTIGPYLFYYGSNGLIANTDINNPTLAKTGDANSNNPVGSKVLKGMPIKGGGQSPAGIFFAEDSVVKISFVGGTLLFQYDIITSQSSVFGKNSVVEYDGKYFWLGLDRALVFSGGVQEIPNQLNSQWFYDNINRDYAYKIWGTKVPKFGEVWWFFPKIGSTECNWAIVYNIREGTWYDTEITRSAGYYTQTFPYPVWGDEDGVLWQHEFGWDEIFGDQVIAIDSYFVSHNIGFPLGGAVGSSPQGANTWTRIERIEPDFMQSGDMYVQIITKEYANSTAITSEGHTWTPTTERVDIRYQGRFMSVKFGSAAQGGTYWMGIPLLHLDIGDRRE